jgi:hypothetical protein
MFSAVTLCSSRLSFLHPLFAPRYSRRSFRQVVLALNLWENHNSPERLMSDTR